MTLQAIAPTALWLPELGPNSATLASMLIDAAGEKAAYIIAAPKAGSIDKVGFRTATVTTGATVIVSLETLDANGDPSGVLWGVNTSAAQVILDTDDNHFFEVTLAAAAVVAKGDRFAVVVTWAAPGVINIARSITSVSLPSFPYTDLFTGTWAKTAAISLGSIRYNDGTYPVVGGLVPLDTVLVDNFQDGTNPDERGNKITIPFKCKVSGIWFVGGSSTGDHTAKLYDSASTLLASKACDGDAGTTGSSPRRVILDTEVTLNAGDVVRASILGTSGALNAQLLNMTCPAGMSAAMPGGGANVFTTRNNNGAWTDTANKMAGIGLILTALDDGIGGASSHGSGKSISLSK